VHASPSTLLVGSDPRVACLGAMSQPPSRVFLWGELPEGPTVAIVGTRSPSEAGAESARRLARELAERGVVIVSGGALGIDSEAHQGALEAGGKTIVFAPAWLHHAYPKENEELFARVLDAGGGYLCLAQEKAAARPAQFFRRNEALVAYSRLLVVGECGFKSGTQNSVKHARRLKKPIGVLPSRFGEEAGLGSNALLNEGADAVLSTDWLLRRLGLSRARPARKRPEDPVARALFLGARTVDEICEATGLAAPLVQHRILLLTLEGRVAEDERGLLRYDPDPRD
jgi:DNA processing protein